MRIKTPFLGSAVEARSLNLASSRCVNIYPELTPEGKDVGGFFGTPGLRQFAQAATAGVCRGMYSYFDTFLFFVIGTTLYYIDSLTMTPYALGTISGTERVSIAANQEGKLFFVAGRNGWIYDTLTSTLSAVTLPNMGGTTDFVDSYFLIHLEDDSVWGIFDGVTFDASEVTTSEAMPDHIQALIVDHNEVWVFGQLSTEVYADVGDADFPFQRIPGAIIPQGCAAKHTPRRLDNSVFWLGQDELGDRVVWKAQGYTPVRVSTHAIEREFQTYGDVSDAFSWAYQQDGHTFYVLTFPTAGKTWAYDCATQLWHQRASLDPETGELGRHRANCCAYFKGSLVVGDSNATGKLFILDLDTFTDGAFGPVESFSPDMYSTDSVATSKARSAVNSGSTHSGYYRGDELTAVGGTFTRPARFLVANNALGATISALTLIDAGDYTVTPTNPVPLSGGTGSGFLANMTWTTGSQTILSDRSGAGYTASPTLAFDTTYGSGAAATAALQLVAARIFITGANYVVGDVLTVSGGTATTAATVGVASVDGGGGISALYVINPGVYTAAPGGGSVSLTGGSGNGAATGTLFWGLGEITLTDGGTDYSQAPTVTVSGAGSGASVDAVLNATTNYIKRLRQWRALPPGQNAGLRLTHMGLTLDGEMGVGIDGTGQGDDPQIMLRVSHDGGHTFGSEHWRSAGRIGETGLRARWPRLGGGTKLRDTVFEISMTDPVKCAWQAAYLDANGGGP